MNCQHPDEVPKENSDEIYRNLYKACRKKGLREMSTDDLIGLKRLLKKATFALTVRLREEFPTLLKTEDGLFKETQDESCPVAKELTQMMFQAVALAVSVIYQFEIEEALSERARKG